MRFAMSNSDSFLKIFKAFKYSLFLYRLIALLKSSSIFNFFIGRFTHYQNSLL